MEGFEELPPRLGAVADLLTRDVEDLTTVEVVAADHDVRVVIRSLQAFGSLLLARIDAEGLAGLGGARNTAEWLAHREHLDVAAARREVSAARSVAAGQVPTLARAWAGGDVDPARAQIVTDTMSTLLDGGLDPEQVAHAEEVLTQQARFQRPSELAKTAKRWRLDLLGERGDRADNPLTRTMTLTQTTAGVGVFAGELDAEGYEVVATALAAFTTANADGDALTPAQRRGQALVQLCRTALAGGASNAAATTVVVTVALATLTAALTENGVGENGVGENGVGENGVGENGVGENGLGEGTRPRRGAAQVQWGQPLTAGTARRLACDANLVPAVLDGPSQPLDLARSRYTVTTALRRALVIRDGGCVHPGCDRPPAHTEAHHLTHWADGGHTKLDNLVLLCSHHHHVVHDTGWSIHLDEHGTPYSTAPRWADPDQRHRYHARHLSRHL